MFISNEAIIPIFRILNEIAKKSNMLNLSYLILFN